MVCHAVFDSIRYPATLDILQADIHTETQKAILLLVFSIKKARSVYRAARVIIPPCASCKAVLLLTVTFKKRKVKV